MLPMGSYPVGLNRSPGGEGERASCPWPEVPRLQVGKVRVEVLSPTLVRLAQEGPRGFEDRATFHVVERCWPGAEVAQSESGAEVLVSTASFVVHLPRDTASLAGVRITDPGGHTLYAFDGTLENSAWLPGPADRPRAWWFADSPRIVPPPWGLTPAQNTSLYPDTSGWDTGNDAPDVYVFLPQGDYRTLRRDFLRLTGPSEAIPLFALGAIDSRWYAYTETTALGQIDAYRSRGIPLDVLVIDTDWRIGASHGYEPNPQYFPDMERFLRAAHEKRVRVMFNDHPEPRGKTALCPEELRHRFDGLAGLLEKGLDVWWYDRNWSVGLTEPGQGLRREVWGMRLYHDITRAVRPGQRPLIMANVDGIDSGKRNRPPNVAAHRYPIQWTGDTRSTWDDLAAGVENAVHAGVHAAFGYLSEDLGGFNGTPSREQYIRWLEYGAFSPIYRTHCIQGAERMPWRFEAESLARDYLGMRYRLLPMWYALARENHLTGEPLLRRLDLDFPDHPEAGRNDQYLLGHGLLVAPLPGRRTPRAIVPCAWLRTLTGQPGLSAEYYPNKDLSGGPSVRRVDPVVDFDWKSASPDPSLPKDNWSARWTGQIALPPGGEDLVLSVTADDGIRLWLDDRLVIDQWVAQDSVTTDSSLALVPGTTHRLRLEFNELTGNAVCRLQWHPGTPADLPRTRSVWLPPGRWIDAWTGQIAIGPATTPVTRILEQIPLWIRQGTLLLLAPSMQHTGEKPWDPITVDVYPQNDTTVEATLYEDDGLSLDHLDGKFRLTPVQAWTDALGNTRIQIGPATGNGFQGAFPSRSWVLRLHLPASATPRRRAEISLGATPIDSWQILPRDPQAMPFANAGSSPDADVLEVQLGTHPVDQPLLLQAWEGRMGR